MGRISEQLSFLRTSVDSVEDRAVNGRIRTQLGLEANLEVIEGISPEVLKRALDVVSRRFSPCQRGESVTDREFSMRLGELRETGYHVGAYSKLKKRQKRAYFLRLRDKIRDEASSVSGSY